jgi:hypothetical protein
MYLDKNVDKYNVNVFINKIKYHLIKWKNIIGKSLFSLLQIKIKCIEKKYTNV